jgi:hypothetical protein
MLIKFYSYKIFILIITVLIISLILYCCKFRDKTLDDKEVINIGLQILNVIYMPANWYYNTELNCAQAPDIYNLFTDSKMSEVFYSDKYWVDIQKWYGIPNPMADRDNYYYIFILPFQDNNYFYLISNRQNISISGEYNLYKFHNYDLNSIKDSIKEDGELLGYDYSMIAVYKISIIGGFKVTVSPNTNSSQGQLPE